MAADETSLTAYQAAEILIVHLRTASPLNQNTKIQLRIGQKVIPEPYFAILLTTKRDYFFVARLEPAMMPDKAVTSVYDTTTNHCLARTATEALTPFAEFSIAPYQETDRWRLRKGLLEKASAVLSPLTNEAMSELALALSEKARTETVEAVSTGNSTPLPPPSIGSHVDGIVHGMLEGWAWNRNAAVVPLPLELWIDGKLEYAAVADLFRLDLKEAGIGQGDHAFRIELPPRLQDGKPHDIEIREALTGSLLTNGKLTFQADKAPRAHIDSIHGLAIAGWLAREYSAAFGDEITVWEHGEIVAKGRANLPSETPEISRFHVPLPPALCDGRVHHLAVRAGQCATVGEIVEVLPYVLTPATTLRRFSGNHLKGSILPNAARRYECLRRQLTHLAKNEGIDPATRKQLDLVLSAHEQLIRGRSQTSGDHRRLPKLDFPRTDNPDVSIIIPAHNHFEATYHCLASLILSPNEASFELVLVDDGSADDTLNITEVVTGIRVLRHDTPQGFVRSCNRGGGAALGRYIVILKNDTEVGPGWLDELLHVFHEQDRIGLAGGKRLDPNGTLREAGGIVWNTGEPSAYGSGANPHDPRYNYLRDVDYVSGACIMLTKPLWDELGGFDETFSPGYFEDLDLAFRVRAKGFRTVYTPFCEILHAEDLSHNTDTGSKTKPSQEINRPKFKKRHIDACLHNGAPGVDMDIAKDRNVRYRVLAIDATTPTPDQDAGSYAAIQEMRLLQSFGCKLTFMPQNLLYLGEYTERLQRMGIECVYAPFSRSPEDFLKLRGKEFNLVYITRYGVAEKYIDTIREFVPQARIAFNNADLHFLREIRTAIAKGSRELMERAQKTRDAELAVMRRVDLTLSYNEVEHAIILSHNLDATRVAKCPWVATFPAHPPPAFAERSDIAFLGGYDHPPNAEAVESFVEEVMPLLRKRLPGVRFLVYGSHPPKSFDTLETDDVIIKGWVGDVAEVYDSCRVFVAPLKTGAGLKGKVVGALAHGVPCVLSPIAAEGIGLGDGREARIAVKPESWVEAIVGIYENEAEWQMYSDAARRFAAREYSFERGRALMAEALAMVDIFAE